MLPSVKDATASSEPTSTDPTRASLRKGSEVDLPQPALRRVVADLLDDALRAARHSIAPPAALTLPPDATLGDGGFGADSLEIASLAASVEEMFLLHEANIEDSLLTAPTLSHWAALAAAALRGEHRQISFRTSGSQGPAKSCTHRLAELEREARFLAGLLPGLRRVVAQVPAHHIYGFIWTVLLPASASVECVDARLWTPGQLQSRLGAGDLLVTFPEQWALLARHLTWPAGVTGVCSTGPCPPELIRTLRHGGLARMLEVYGCTELGGVGWREAPDGPYQLFDHLQRGGSGGADLEHCLEHRLEHSRATGAPLPALPDHVEWLGERCFRLAGRRDQAVQVGGVNVYPERVQRALAGHPYVLECAVRLMRPDQGTRLKAYVVLRPDLDSALAATELPRWLQDRLSSVEQPRAWRFGSALPVDVQGKPCDW
jgi:4-coumarate--CoA ligase (photoactive yellow protein activation family)